MKVLLLVDNLVSGGMQRRLIELIKGLKNHQDVHLYLVVFNDNIHYKEVFELGVPVKILVRVPKQNPMVFYRLLKLCRRWKPDLIHSWGTMSAIIAIPSSLLLGIRLINGNIVNAPKKLHFFDERLFRARLTFPFSKVIVSNSQAGLTAYNVPKKKGLCIYNGFDGNRILNLKDKKLVKEEFNIHTKNVIGMVASFSDRKDFYTYIRAALNLLSYRKDVTFVAVGDGPNLMKCIEMVPPEFASFFKFTGVQKDVESIVNIFDIGVLSTNTRLHGEGISNAILEYMALEKPTIATTGGGTNEVVDHMKTGILIPPDSPEILAKKLTYLLENTNTSKTMGLNAKSRLEQSFSLTKMTSTYYQLYRSLLN